MVIDVKQRLWKYRGHRIRPNDEYAVLRAGLGVFMPVFLLTLAVYFWEGLMEWRSWLGIDTLIELQAWNWMYLSLGLAVSIVVGAIAVAMAYFFFYERFKKTLHIQKIARMLVSNNFMEKEKKTVDSTWALTEKKVNKDKITYFPKAYYKRKKGYVYVRLALDMSRFQDRFLKLGEELENGLFCNLVEQEVEENFVKYKLLYDMQKNRISINDVTVHDGSMKLMNNVYWEFDKMPHMLIAGGTGGGKTYFILTMIQSLVAYGADVRILDPKKADLADLETVMPERTVFSKSNGIMMTLRKSVEAMHQRSEDMKQLPDYQTGSNYADVGLPPVFIVFDEFVAFMEMLEPQDKMKALEYMKQLVMLGRQMGYFLILAAQRPDAKYLADGIRDQFSFRVALGKMSESGYGMMFGDVDKTFSYRGIKGRGYADTGTSVITEFYTPIVPKGYDLLTEIGRASAGVERASAPAGASGSVARGTDDDAREEGA
ncbi:DNA translocase FtsK [Salicibibacter halophilus]|uniref:DNA translocase FtsK n=1 Tax=Salicibibacter halophilus TaxID=2502791 RepID=A0A514LKW0_9BACI|nr:FtsK/SpoIIIE domain-containing protein [Salicibibacter halophilus]QDI92489.1 DNA translocase FtsK [Salicibibacter halophilus]